MTDPKGYCTLDLPPPEGFEGPERPFGYISRPIGGEWRDGTGNIIEYFSGSEKRFYPPGVLPNAHPGGSVFTLVDGNEVEVKLVDGSWVPWYHPAERI